MLRESDLVVLFEPRNFGELRRAFPQYVDKIVMLGAMLRPVRTSIDDPYQRTTAETEYIAAQVDAALAELASVLGLSATSSAAPPTTTGPALTRMVSGL
jgi:protein-tyrosine-phosphatase